MKNNPTIRRVLAGFFLLLFTFCVTPKRFLHDLLANHKDATGSNSLPTQQIATSGFHCHADDLVVVAPFIPEIQCTIPATLSSSTAHFAEPVNSFLSIPVKHNDGRGPPADFCS